MAQPLIYPHTTMTQPPVYPPTAMAQSSLHQHREIAQLHLKPSSTMAQVPPYPHPDSGQDPLYPHLHMAQISPQPPLDEHIVMEGSKHLQTEHGPVKRAKLPEDVLNRALVNHKASMKRRFERISEGVIRSETQTLLNKIYTKLFITEGESEGVNNEHEVWQVESASRSQTTEDTAINCNDIFKPLPGQQRPIRTAMTKGIAGIGKTVSVQKFILDWAEEKANQDVDFMLILPFRELNLVKYDQYSLHRLLLDFHPELRELQDGEYKDRHILFIFDGLDESRLPLNFHENQKLSDVTQTSSVDVLMTSLIQGSLLPSALIWITSRPAAASQIPSQCIDQVTEVRGFNDPQKEEYFRKKISDQNQANRIISHIKASKSLLIMCHMPVFCWISATVLQHLLEQDDGKEAPNTLTEMFIHFLLIQTTRKNQKYQEENDRDKQRLLESHKDVILKLAQLAFKHLQNGNLMFYEEDLKECGIDVSDASVYSGMCTEIFREECVIHHKKVFCFVHLSIQEFLAAMFVFHSYISEHFEILKSFISKKHKDLQNLPLHVLLKGAIDKALDSKNGHLDLFLRFLVGISVESNQALLQGLLSNTHSSSESIRKTCQYIKILKRKDLSPERCINLSHCLFEMNDHSQHRKVQTYLKSSDGFSDRLTVAQCSALAHMLMMSEEVLDEFDLTKYNTSEEGWRRLMPVVRNCRKARLAGCKLTERSCEIVASALQSANSPLRQLDLSQNDLQQSGEKLLSTLQSPSCKLETLRLASCKLTERSCEIVASALQSANSPFRELDLSQNDLQQTLEKLLSTLQSPNCKLETLRLAGCKLTERSWEIVASALQSANSPLRQLDLSQNDLQQSGENLSSALQRPNCKLETLRLPDCKITEESCKAVASALQSSVSLTELDLTNNYLNDSGIQLLSAGLSSPHCKLQTLRLSGCLITHQGCSFLASALKSNPSYLKQLDLSYNHPGDSGVRELTDRLNDPNCKLENFRYDHGGECWIKLGLRKYACELTLDPNTAHRELSLSEGNRKVTHVSEKKLYPDHPERFDCWTQVLCREGQSGRCYWNAEWSSDVADIAVAYKSIQRKGARNDSSFGYNDKSWSLECSGNSYSARHNKKITAIPAPSSRSSRVEVYLDWPAGTLSFYSVSSDTFTHLHTFHSTFTEPLYPGFNVWQSSVSLCQSTLPPNPTGTHNDTYVVQSSLLTGIQPPASLMIKSSRGKGGMAVCFGNNKSWTLYCSGKEYSLRHNDKKTDIPAPSSRSSRVGVYLDWPAGTLSFYSISSDTLTHLHTFHSTFTEPLYPGFRVSQYNSAVSLCPVLVVGLMLGLSDGDLLTPAVNMFVVISHALLWHGWHGYSMSEVGCVSRGKKKTHVSLLSACVFNEK
ncbi:NACHT, LRR and PYD domains-containing protein 12-like [Clupea harengus]|uniref:NACHT, LRR and PYD domains-containing protein 12-like n=1 Tax=Clupea harengus TaxID=7950 RepID=A0A8M1KEH1_CLUHA|nr:NACHT, LRR and PYD domains-containing protein 12-like [Clupea harengus]